MAARVAAGSGGCQFNGGAHNTAYDTMIIGIYEQIMSEEVVLAARLEVLQWMWGALFPQHGFPCPKGRASNGDVTAIQQQISAKLRELASTDRDRRMMWSSLGHVQQVLRSKDEAVAGMKDHIHQAEREIDRLVDNINEENREDCARLRRLLPADIAQTIPRTATKDDLYEYIAEYQRSLQEESADRISSQHVHEIPMIIAEKEAAYAEIRVLRARLAAFSSLPGKSRTYPRQLAASTIAVAASLSPVASPYAIKERQRRNGFELDHYDNESPQRNIFTTLEESRGHGGSKVLVARVMGEAGTCYL